jgi:signal transduction histidine kinase
MAEARHLARVEAEAAALGGHFARVMLNAQQVWEVRQQGADEIARFGASGALARQDARAGISLLEEFLERPADATVRASLDRIDKAATSAADLLSSVIDPEDGTSASFTAARARADLAFTEVSEQVPLPTEDFLAAKRAQETFLADPSPGAAAVAIAALHGFEQQTGTFPGLSAEQRRRLAVAAGSYRVTFAALADAILQARSAVRDVREQALVVGPAISQLRSAANEKAARLRQASISRDRTAEAFATAFATVTLGAFSIHATAMYRRLRSRDRRLSELRDQFRDFALATSDLLWEIDPTRRVTATWGGLPSIGVVGKRDSELDVTELSLALGFPLETLDAALSRADGFRDIEHSVRRHGTVLWFTTSGTAFLDDEGRFAGLRCASRDITEQKRQAEAQNVVEQRLATLVDSQPIVLFRVEGSPEVARYTFVTPGAERIVGYTPEELLARPLVGDHWLIIPEDRERFSRETREGLRLNGVGVSRGRVRTADGLRWIQQTVRRVTEPGGLGKIEGMWLDVTNEEIQLRQLIEFARAIDVVGEAIFIVDRKTREIVYYNHGYTKLFGIPGFPLAGRRTVGQLGEAVGLTNADLAAWIEREVDLPSGWRGDFTYRLHSGQILHLVGSARSLPDTRLVVVLTDVTAQVAQQKRMAAVSMAVDNASDGMAIFESRSGPIVYANEAMRRMLRLPDDLRLEGRYFYEVLPQRQKVLALRESLIASKDQRPAHTQVELQRADGSPVVADVRVVTLPDERVLLTAVDVTEEVGAQRAKDKRERAMTELGSDRALPSLDVPDAAARIARAAADGLGAGRVSIWLYTDGADEIMALSTYNAATGESRNGTLVPIEAHRAFFERVTDRRPIVVTRVDLAPELESFRTYYAAVDTRSVIVVPIMRENEAVGFLTCEHVGETRVWNSEEVQFCLHLADFTALSLEGIARRRSVVALEHANRRLTAVVRALDAAEEGIAIQAADGTLTYANSRFLQLTRAPMNVLRQYDSPLAAVRSLLGAGLPSGLGRLLEDGSPLDREFAVQLRGDEERVYDFRVAPLQAGGAIYALADITERHAREARERVLIRQLSDARRFEAIGSLAGGVAHDFNNIIGAVRGYADLLATDLPASTEPHRYATRILAACRRAADLVKEIMAFSQLKASDRAPVAVRDLLADIADILVSRAEKHVKLELDNQSGDATVLGNASQIRQVLENLVVNAADASQEGMCVRLSVDIVTPDRAVTDSFSAEGVRTTAQGCLAVTSGTLAPGPCVRLCVTDTGSGIPAHLLPRIFEPFFTTKDKMRGTGLGLALVAGIVDAHGGGIRVETRLGAGTSFEVFLPVAAAASAETGAAPVTDASPERLTGTERILIVDDEADIAESIAIALARLGYETAPVFDPVEALELLSEEPEAWDVIISDQAMPKLRGLELIKRAREFNPMLKSIICTGYRESLTEERAASEGIDRFFDKPVAAQDLARAIRGLCDPIPSV